MTKLPESFQTKMQFLLGEAFDNYLEEFQHEKYRGIRINTLKIMPEDFEKISPFDLKRIPWTTNGYYVSNQAELAKHPYYHAGLYYIQEPSAMLPAAMLPIEEGDKVLDLCAAPGGKSTELGARLRGTGLLVSNDVSYSRTKALQKNIELFGIPNSIIMSEDPSKLAKPFHDFFDKILIDAPCSGEGMFRKDSAMIKNWSLESVQKYSTLQKKIIVQAAGMLKPGGMMLYSTCTFSPEENEETIMHLLRTCPDFTIEKVPSYPGFDKGHAEYIEHGVSSLENCIRLWPHRIKGEGHFAALLRKKAEQHIPSDKKQAVKGQKLDLTEFQSFCTSFLQMNNSVSLDFTEKWMQTNLFRTLNQHLYLLPEEHIPLEKLRIVRAGWSLGDIKKNRFEPSQALALGLQVGQVQQTVEFQSDDDKLLRYLKGETIEIEDTNIKGWTLICVDGFPLGWSKANQGILKNKYHIHWRIN